MSGVEQTGIEEARRGLGEIVDRARLKGEATMITRTGKPAAVIVPVEWYDQAQTALADADGLNWAGGAS